MEINDGKINDKKISGAPNNNNITLIDFNSIKLIDFDNDAEIRQYQSNKKNNIELPDFYKDEEIKPQEMAQMDNQKQVIENKVSMDNQWQVMDEGVPISNALNQYTISLKKPSTVNPHQYLNTEGAAAINTTDRYNTSQQDLVENLQGGKKSIIVSEQPNFVKNLQGSRKSSIDQAQQNFVESLQSSRKSSISVVEIASYNDINNRGCCC